MLDRIIDELLASYCSWRVDMGMMGPNRESRNTTSQSSPTSSPTPRRSSPVSKNNAVSNNPEDPEYFQRIMQSRYPEHMLHCPQTSLYPIFFFLMERWEARRAAAKESLLPPATPTASSPDNPNE